MAVKDESLYHATESLILASPRKFYRAYMHAEHPQLRSFITSPTPSVIYYPGGCDIYRLNTATREREIVTTLPFSPRCLTAANGWVCCGGELGNFAAIRLGSGDGRVVFTAETEATGPETRLPLDLDPVRRLYLTPQPESNTANQNQADETPLARATKIGKEIVNCVTLWFPKADEIEPTYRSPVAVLSNNDHTVSIVDLTDSEEVDKLELDDCVNRAVISPDGRLLITVGDDPFMHIYHRKRRSPRMKFESSSDSRSYNWVKGDQIFLTGQFRGNTDDMKGTFAAEFSPSGRYLAIGTQYGMISIFDTRALVESSENATIVSFTTSRPKSKAGAVRAMEFSPEPFDLLAWTEDSGRIIVADIRQNFLSRQIINMEPHGDGVDTVGIVDRSSEFVIDPRLRSFHNESDGTLTDNIIEEMQRRRLRQLAALENGGDHQAPFTANDTEVLEVMQMQRRRREREAARTAAREAAREAIRDTTNATHLSWTDLADDIRSTYRNSSQNGLPSSLREFISNRSNESLRAYINERNIERERRSGGRPIRGASLILAAAQSALNRDSRESNRESGADATSSTDNPTSSILPFTPTTDSPRNPWSEMEALYNMTIDAPMDSTARMQIEVDDEARREASRTDRREQTTRLRRAGGPWRGLEDGLMAGLEPATQSRSRISEPNQTTGCSWSPDGRILYVGTETGIFEHSVNLAGRKTFASVTAR